MPRLPLPARRYPAGVDRHFDDIETDAREMIRLALSGHVFEAMTGEGAGESLCGAARAVCGPHAAAR